MEKEIKQFVTKLWWLWVGFAVLSMAFGVVAIFWPDFIVWIVAVAIAALVMVSGLGQIWRGIQQMKTRQDWWAAVIIGLILFALGVFLAKNFIVTVAIFAMVIGWVFILRGLMDLAIARFVDSDGSNWWKLSAIVGMLAGVIMIIYPLGSSAAFAWVIGVYALFSGMVMFMRAQQARVVTKGSRR